jgi:hypothetical protein
VKFFACWWKGLAVAVPLQSSPPEEPTWRIAEVDFREIQDH